MFRFCHGSTVAGGRQGSTTYPPPSTFRALPTASRRAFAPHSLLIFGRAGGRRGGGFYIIQHDTATATATATLGFGNLANIARQLTIYYSGVLSMYCQNHRGCVCL